MAKYIELLQSLADNAQGGVRLQGWLSEWSFFKGHATQRISVAPWFTMACSTLSTVVQHLAEARQLANAVSDPDALRQAFLAARRQSLRLLTFAKQLGTDMSFSTGWLKLGNAMDIGSIARAFEQNGLQMLSDSQSGRPLMSPDGEYMFLHNDSDIDDATVLQLATHSIASGDFDIILNHFPQYSLSHATPTRRVTCLC